jgi:hypothetical protein
MLAWYALSMKTILKAAILMVVGAVAGFGQSIFNTWVVSYQASTQGSPTMLLDGTRIIPSWLETMAIDGSFAGSYWGVNTSPITDFLASAQQSACLGRMDINGPGASFPAMIINSCIVSRNNVVIGTRKTYLQAITFTPTSFKGFFRCVMLDQSGNLLVDFSGTVNGTAVPNPDTDADWNIVGQLPMPTP